MILFCTANYKHVVTIYTEWDSCVERVLVALSLSSLYFIPTYKLVQTQRVFGWGGETPLTGGALNPQCDGLIY